MIYRRIMTEHVSGDDARLPQRRHLVTEIPGPVSRELLARRERAVARGVSHVLPVFVTDAGGGVIVDADGNSLIDFGSGIAVVSVGNAAPRVSARVAEQAARFTHTCFMVTPYEGYVEVCEELASRTPGTHDKRSALFNSGAEAVENAVKIARHATGRQAVVAFDHAYHGRTNLTMALTAKNMPYKDKFGPFAGEIYRMPMAYPLRWPGGREACATDALPMIKSLIHTQVGEDNVAAVIIEPIQGEGGFIVPPDGFLPHRRLVRLRARRRGTGHGHHGQGHRGRAPAGRGDRAHRDHGLGARGRPGRYLRRQPGGLRRGAGRHRDHAAGRSVRGGPADRVDHVAAPDRAGPEVRGDR
jgi:4-aminobutyrate aminotransferase-like enzyme